MSIPGIRFITSNTPGSGNGVGIGLSAVRGPTGPAGAFGGPQGNIGVQGTTGTQGFQGLIGLQGLIGPTGTIGINGVQGSQGHQGLIGSTGSKGNDGLQGLIGATGSIGLQGGAGMGFVVFANTNSYTGLNTVIATGGNIGQFVLVLGGDLFVYAGTGSGYTGPSNSYGYAGDVTDETKLFGMQGYQGLVGLQGLQGLMGSTGASGLQGLQGLVGSTGSVGPQGLQGLQGIIGSTGMQGYQGLQGLVGSTGMQGYQGLQGLMGATGMQGYQGLQGLVGSTGMQGYQGLQGLVGSTGMQGYQGLQGLVGSTGMQGYQGLQGLVGSTGMQGYQGLVGLTGLQGATGSIGPQGGAGMGFVVFANTTSYTGLSDLSPTGGNIGQFVLVLGGDLFVYAGTGSGYTGPENSYGYAGDVTDESKLYGTQGPVGVQGLIGLQGPTGTNGMTGSIGLQGIQGATGSVGLQGSIGLQGLIGSAIGAIYYFNQIEYSDISGYSVMSRNINISTGTSITISGAGTQQAGTGFVSPIGDPNISSIAGGTWNFEIYANLNANGGIPGIYASVLILHTGGSETLLGDNSANPLLVYNGTIKTLYMFSVPIAQTPISLTDRLLVRFYGIDLGAKTMTLYFQDTSIAQVTTSLSAAVGYQGYQGHTGLQGVQGLQGATGLQGVQGLQGATGTQGYQGFQGATGTQGYQGLIGYQGIAGPTGVGGALGYYGSFFDTTIQAITVANTGYVMTYNNTLESNGIFVSNGSRINFQNGGVYNLQFSAQFDKTDSGTDTIDVWLRQNGVNVPWTNTRLTSVGNNDKMVAAWNFMQSVTANDYLELVWMSNDIGFRIYSETGTVNPVRPEIPSVILTAQQVMNTQLGPQGPQGAGSVGGVSSQLLFNQSGEATGSNRALTYLESSTGSIIYSGSDIVPLGNALYNLGSPDNLWKSIYISTGTIFIGPTGTLGLDNNGVISSAGGFASPFITVGSTNPGTGITLYNNQNNLWFQNQSGATGAISIWNVAQNNINNTFFTGGNIGIGTSTPNYPLTVKGPIYCEGLTGTNLPIGLKGPTGLAGPQGIAGNNGASSSLILYLDTAGGSYAGVAQTGSLMVVPNQGTQTTITSGNQTNTTINIANFISGNVPSTIIRGGNWDLNLFGFASAISTVSFYFETYYVDSDGVSNQTLLAAGTGPGSVFLQTSQSLTTNSLYIPETILPDTTHRILIKIYLVFSGNNRNATLEFRDGTISHLHTTILSPDIAAGQSSQIIFNQSGAYTGSSNLTYNYSNNVVTLPNVIASSGSFTNLLLSSSSIHLGGSAGSVNQKANSVAIGNSAGQTNQGTGTSSQGYSVSIGHLSGNNNQGYGSVSIGYSSGQTSQGELSVSIGTSSGNISQGTRSVGIGQGAGYQYQGAYSIAMGDSSGQDYQGTESVSIGRNAGLTYQNPYSVAIGSYAGSAYQSTGNVNAGSVAVGSHAGQTLQRYQAVALGYYAGNQNQGANSVAIGANAGYQNQSNNSIVINASGNQINGTGTGFFVNPVRNVSGGNLLTYNIANSEISYSNTLSQVVNISANNNATGSSTGALIVSGGINVNGESVFNNLVYAPQLNPNFINRGNPGQASPLLLSNYNTVHYYSTTSATGFVDISTTMVENAIYEVEFNCYGANASNDDMFLFPNHNTSFSSTTFYNVYTNSSSTPNIQYSTGNSNGFYFDYVSGSIGWEPVGKIKIFNNRSAKKVKVECGDTTAIVNGQGYWTSGSGFTSNSVTNIVYDTATQWSNIGRLSFSANGTITFTNWNIWVKRIM